MFESFLKNNFSKYSNKILYASDKFNKYVSTLLI